MPQRSSAAPGWLVRVINKVMKGLDRLIAYLDNVIVFDSGSSGHVAKKSSNFERRFRYNLKLSLSNAQTGTTQADVLGHKTVPRWCQSECSQHRRARR